MEEVKGGAQEESEEQLPGEEVYLLPANTGEQLFSWAEIGEIACKIGKKSLSFFLVNSINIGESFFAILILSRLNSTVLGAAYLSSTIARFVEGINIGILRPSCILAGKEYGHVKRIEENISSLPDGDATITGLQGRQATHNQAISMIMHQGFLIGLAFILLEGPALWFIKPILSQVGQAANIITYVEEFCQWYIFSLPFAILNIQMINLLAATDREKYLIVFNLVVSGVGLLSSYVLINGYLGFPSMGIGGYGLSKVVGRVLGSFVFLLIIIFDKYLKDLQLHSVSRRCIEYFKSFMILGGPLALLSGAKAGIGLGLSFFIGGLGEYPLNIEQSSSAYLTWVQGISAAIAQATGVFLAQKLGVREYNNIRKYARVGLIMNIATYILPIVLFCVMPLTLAKLFLSNKILAEEESLIRLNYALSVIAVTLSVTQSYFAFILAFVKDTFAPSIISLATGALVTLLCAYLFSDQLDLGLVGINLAMLTGAVLSSVFMCLRWHYQSTDANLNHRREHGAPGCCDVLRSSFNCVSSFFCSSPASTVSLANDTSSEDIVDNTLGVRSLKND